MSWQQVYNLLVQYSGREAIPPADLEAALAADGHGDRDVQIRIAELEYVRSQGTENGSQKTKRKEANDGQEKWHFG